MSKKAKDSYPKRYYQKNRELLIIKAREKYQKNKEKILKIMHAWYNNHKATEEYKQKRREYYQKHRKRLLKSQKQWRLNNPEKAKESVRKYQLKIRDKFLQYKKEYNAKHREQYNEAARKKRLKERAKKLYQKLYHKNYYQKNKKKIQEYQNKWRHKNKDRQYGYVLKYKEKSICKNGIKKTIQKQKECMMKKKTNKQTKQVVAKTPKNLIRWTTWYDKSKKERITRIAFLEGKHIYEIIDTALSEFFVKYNKKGLK